MSMLSDLWRHRERPATVRRTLVVWAKRARTLPTLLKHLAKTARLRRTGASIGNRALPGRARLVGKGTNLSIADEATLGRCRIELHAPVAIGRAAVVNDGVVILTGTHDLQSPSWELKAKAVSIGDYAWIATNAIVLPGVTIGRGAVVGAGAVVRTDVPDFALAVGNPAVVVPEQRSRALDYSPYRLVAMIEAWLGTARGSGSLPDLPR